jgi:hypothetical protein
MAIKITENTREKLSIMRGGPIPAREDDESYFFFPYSYDSSCKILPADEFFKTYRFSNKEDENNFVDVDQI